MMELSTGSIWKWFLSCLKYQIIGKMCLWWCLWKTKLHCCLHVLWHCLWNFQWHCIGCCTYCGSSEINWLMSGTKRLTHNIPPSLNPTINPVLKKKNKRNAFAEVACYFSLFLQVFELLLWLVTCTKCSALQMQCCTRWVIKQVYHIRKTIHIELVRPM